MPPNEVQISTKYRDLTKSKYIPAYRVPSIPKYVYVRRVVWFECEADKLCVAVAYSLIFPDAAKAVNDLAANIIYRHRLKISQNQAYSECVVSSVLLQQQKEPWLLWIAPIGMNTFADRRE